MTAKKRAAQPFHNRAAINERPRPDTMSGYSRIAHNFKLFISTAGISIGVALLFIAAAADMTVSTGQITELCVLGLLSAFGGMWGLKWEGVLDR